MRDFKLFVNILLVLSLFIPYFSASAEKMSEELYFTDGENRKVNIEAFDGNVVILHFWATWCSACITEMPDLDRFQKEYRKKPLKIIALSEDYKGISAVKNYYNAHSIKNLDIYIDNKNTLFKEMAIPSLPFTILIDKSGNIVETYKGTLNWNDEDFRKTIDFELKKAI